MTSGHVSAGSDRRGGTLTVPRRHPAAPFWDALRRARPFAGPRTKRRSARTKRRGWPAATARLQGLRCSGDNCTWPRRARRPRRQEGRHPCHHVLPRAVSTCHPAPLPRAISCHSMPFHFALCRSELLYATPCPMSPGAFPCHPAPSRPVPCLAGRYGLH